MRIFVTFIFLVVIYHPCYSAKTQYVEEGSVRCTSAGVRFKLSQDPDKSDLYADTHLNVDLYTGVYHELVHTSDFDVYTGEVVLNFWKYTIEVHTAYNQNQRPLLYDVEQFFLATTRDGLVRNYTFSVYCTIYANYNVTVTVNTTTVYNNAHGRDEGEVVIPKDHTAVKLIGQRPDGTVVLGDKLAYSIYARDDVYSALIPVRCRYFDLADKTEYLPFVSDKCPRPFPNYSHKYFDEMKRVSATRYELNFRAFSFDHSSRSYLGINCDILLCIWTNINDCYSPCWDGSSMSTGIRYTTLPATTPSIFTSTITSTTTGYTTLSTSTSTITPTTCTRYTTTTPTTSASTSTSTSTNRSTRTPTTSTSRTTPTTTTSTSTTTPTTSTSTSTRSTTTRPFTTTIPPECQRCNADVVFLIDESSCIIPINFYTYVIPFMVDLTYGLQISYEKTHLSVIHFSDSSSQFTAVDAHLNTFYYPFYIDDLIRGLQLQGGNTSLYTALNLAYTDVLTKANGARVDEWGKTVAPYVIFITDDVATDSDKGNPSDLAYTMLTNGISLYAVGVGALVTKEYLSDITHDDSRVFMVHDFPGLSDKLVKIILEDTCCPIKPTPPPQCEKIDLIFVLDECESVNQPNGTGFDFLKNYLVNLTSIFNINQEFTRVAAIGYGRKGRVYFHLYNSSDYSDLTNRIRSMDFVGGARNVSGGLREALEEVTNFGRQELGVPMYLVHIVDYAHDTGDNPLTVATALGSLKDVTMFAVTVTDFQYDDIFNEETVKTVNAVGHGSMQFNASSYSTLYESGLHKKFEEIIRKFPCATTPFPRTTTAITKPTTTPTPVCQRCIADVVFLIDESSSITLVNFERYILPFLVNLTLGLQISYEKTHLSVVHFSSSTTVDAYLNTFYNPTQLANLIRGMTYNGGDTALYSALELTYTDVFSERKGARVREWGNTVAAYAIIITDGIATDYDRGDPSEIAYQMLMSNISINAVGVGSLVTREYLSNITYDDSRVYMVERFPNLSEVLAEIILNDTCCPIDIEKPKPTPPQKYCDVMDLIFVLDESDSAIQEDPNNFDYLKDYLVTLTNVFTMGQQNTRVSVVGYGKSSNVYMHFFESDDQEYLRTRIQNMTYLGGARNVSGGLEAARQEILNYSRYLLGTPTYIIHVVKYAHDVGDDPATVAKKLGLMNVVIFVVTITDFQYDSVFDQETRTIVNAVGHGSMQFNATSYQNLFASGLQEKFQEIMKSQFSCNTPASNKRY